MATFSQVRQKISQLSSRMQQATPTIIAETAVEYFKESFTIKGWNGTPWPQAKEPPTNGSLMVRSAALVSSIRPRVVTAKEVIISAGSPRVPYAKIHNQGGTIKQVPTAKQRRFFWAMEYKNNPNAKDDTPRELGRWGKMAQAKELSITIPQRKFAGHSPELNRRIIARLKPLLKYQ